MKKRKDKQELKANLAATCAAELQHHLTQTKEQLAEDFANSATLEMMVRMDHTISVLRGDR